MALTSFAKLPPSARLWVYNMERPLTHQENDLLRANLEAFLGRWLAHGSPLVVGYDIVHDRFILIGIDDSVVGPGGCSIDAFTRFLREAGDHLGIEILDAPEVCFRDGEEIRCVTRGEFMMMAERGEVDTSTHVFDNTISRVGELTSGRWEVPAREAWHTKAFDLKEAASA